MKEQTRNCTGHASMNEERVACHEASVSINAIYNIIRFCEDVYNLHIIKKWHFSISHHGMVFIAAHGHFGPPGAQFIHAEVTTRQ
jgi:hypothetical protein